VSVQIVERGEPRRGIGVLIRYAYEGKERRKYLFEEDYLTIMDHMQQD